MSPTLCLAHEPPPYIFERQRDFGIRHYTRQSEDHTPTRKDPVAVDAIGRPDVPHGKTALHPSQEVQKRISLFVEYTRYEVREYTRGLKEKVYFPDIRFFPVSGQEYFSEEVCSNTMRNLTEIRYNGDAFLTYVHNNSFGLLSLIDVILIGFIILKSGRILLIEFDTYSVASNSEWR